MSKKTMNLAKTRSPKEILLEQISSALAVCQRAELSERVRQGIARKKAACNEAKRITDHSS